MSPAAQEALDALRAVGGGLRLVDGEIRILAPSGVVSTQLRAELAAHRAEFLELLGFAAAALANSEASRRTAVTSRMAAAYDRLNASAPWPAESFRAAEHLAELADLEARRYAGGESTDLRAFEAAMARWEAALLEHRGGRANQLEMLRPTRGGTQ